MPGPAVEVEGLAQFRRDLKDIDRNLPKELGQEFRKISELIVTAASQKATLLGGVAAKAADAIKATSRSDSATVRLKASDKPYVLGAEFGGQRRPTTQQFEPWRGSDENAGYFLYPAIREREQEMLSMYAEAVGRVTALAFPERTARMNSMVDMLMSATSS